MAKAKEQQATEVASTEATGQPRKAPAKKAAGKKSAPQHAARTAPVIDTSAAANTAATMVARRDQSISATPATGGSKPDSASFKQFKQNLNKPAAQGPASFLHSTSPQKKLNLPMGGRKQVGHNQTFGADVNRSGVPRRTGG